MTVSLDCEADARPKVVGRWRKDGAEVGEDSQRAGRVIVDRASREDVGWYQVRKNKKNCLLNVRLFCYFKNKKKVLFEI